MNSSQLRVTRSTRLLTPDPIPLRTLLAAAILGLLAIAGAFADPIAFRRVAIPEDVPAHLCTALAQDRAGFLWIGTQGGLVRFDGSAFRVYRSDPADVHSLSGSYVRSLLAARDGSVWAGTFSGGLSHLDPATGVFTRYRHDGNVAASLADDRVEGLAEGVDGSIWVATNAGLDRLEGGSGRFEHFRHTADATSLSHDIVRGLLVDKTGHLWVGTRDGLNRLRPDGHSFERIDSTAGVADSLAGEFVTKVYEDQHNRIWIGTAEHGAAVYDPAAGSLVRLGARPQAPEGLSHFWIYGFAEGPGEEMWVATFGGGVDVVDERTLSVVDRLKHDATLDDTIGADRVGAILRDHAGVLWIGSWGEGLAWHDPLTRPFQAIRYTPTRPAGLSHPSVVRALARPNGTIWAGTNGNGIDVLDARGTRIDAFRADRANPDALADPSITCLAEAPDGAVWVATLDGSLHRQAPDSRRFTRFTVAGGLPGGPIRTLAFTRDGAAWAGAAHGLARIDPATQRVTTWRHRAADPSSLSGDAVEAIAVAANGHLWIGTENGLDDFEPSTGRSIAIVRDARRRDSLPDNWVPDLMIAHDGRLWIATQSGAAVLRSWDGTFAHFDVISEKTGRTATPAESVIEDATGSIWIGPRLRVDPRNWRSATFGRPEGCGFHSFFIASRDRMRDGKLLFGSPEGLMLVDPAAIRPWTFEPPVVATDLRVNGKRFPMTTALNLQPNERAFAVDFAALDLTGRPIAYRYRLDGLDRSWTAADDAHRSIAYGRIPPGNFLLRVGAMGRGGGWSTQELRLPIRVVPAMTETTAFRAMEVLAIVLAAYLLYRVRVARLRARSDALERVVEVRTHELAGKHRELESAYALIEQASLTDPLTRLRNRRYLEQSIEADLAIARRRHRDGSDVHERDLLFLLLDLDHFKSVNDTYGHPAGDAVLVQVGRILQKTFRESDHIVRWGGEEFLVVARFVDHASGAILAEKLRAAIEAHPFTLPDGTAIRRTASIGFACWPASSSEPEAMTWEQVVKMADAAMYAAKSGGRNRWVGADVSSERDPIVATVESH